MSQVCKKNANHKSSPGPDGVPFGILYHLPSTHLVMATIFNKGLATSAVLAQWGESIIKLIHKRAPQMTQAIFALLHYQTKS